MKWSVGAKIGAGFLLSLVILVVIGMVSYGSITSLIESSGWVEHAHEVRSGKQRA